MDFIAIFIYGLVNVSMVVYHLTVPGYFHRFPFWAGVIALGWFMPQAVGGYHNADRYPDNAYWMGMLFAALCTVFLWVGFSLACSRKPDKPGWLDMEFNTVYLYRAGVLLSVSGFYFMWKLWSLPEEMLNASQWSGATVRYYFLGNIFIFGFLILWLLYLSGGQWKSFRLLLFIAPSLAQLLEQAFIGGRRGVMMNLLSFTVVGLWLVRRIAIPRWVLVSGLCFGLLFVNAIGLYRHILKQDITFGEKVSLIMDMDLSESTESLIEDSGKEFNNYMIYRHIYDKYAIFDFGLLHWNQFVFNYVPAQLVGRTIKDGLMMELRGDPMQIARDDFGYVMPIGSTTTGYMDSYGSFGWFGFIKFMFIGLIMGALYRHAMQGHLLGQLLYLYSLGPAMHAVTHLTHKFLISGWVYFFGLVFPVLYLSRYRASENMQQGIEAGPPVLTENE